MRPSRHRSSRSVRSVSAVSTSSAEKASSISSSFGMHDQRARHADALAHAARQLLGIGALVAVEADQVDRRERQLCRSAGATPLRLQADLDVLAAP